MKKIIFIVILFAASIVYAKQPEWVYNPSVEGYSTCEIGFAASISNIDIQEKIARAQAMAALSKAIKVNVDTVSESHSRTGQESSFNTSSKQTSSQIIDNAMEIDRWVDEKNNLYLLLCIK